jgi:hypothetical protein
LQAIPVVSGWLWAIAPKLMLMKPMAAHTRSMCFITISIDGQTEPNSLSGDGQSYQREDGCEDIHQHCGPCQTQGDRQTAPLQV